MIATYTIELATASLPADFPKAKPEIPPRAIGVGTLATTCTMPSATEAE